MKTTLAKTMLSAWSCVGLVATFQGENLTIFDPNLSFCDPNYRVCLEFDVAEYGQVRQVLWNSVGSHLLVATEGNFILLYSQEVGRHNHYLLRRHVIYFILFYATLLRRPVW